MAFLEILNFQNFNVEVFKFLYKKNVKMTISDIKI